MIRMIRHIIMLFIMLSIGFSSNQYEFSFSDRECLTNEILSIKNESIEPSNFIFPYISESDSDFYNIIKNNRYSSLYPVLGIRYSNSSFELFPKYINSELLWVTPG